jgi:hypothetical protein
MDFGAEALLKPPRSTLSLRFCAVCGRDDRVHYPLKDRHYNQGRMCDGVVEVLTYRLDRRVSTIATYPLASTTLPASTDRDVEDDASSA